MANVEHNTLTGAQLHESKGTAAASENEIFVADGAGSGAFKNTILTAHGEMVVEAGTTVTATTAAGDATLSTNTDYVDITGDWSAGHLAGITYDTDKITVSVDGDYYISFWADILVPSNNNFIGIKHVINVDGTPQYSTRKLLAQSNTAADIINVAGMGMIPGLSAGDTISVAAASTKTDNLVIKESGLMCFLLHET